MSRSFDTKILTLFTVYDFSGLPDLNRYLLQIYILRILHIKEAPFWKLPYSRLKYCTIQYVRLF